MKYNSTYYFTTRSHCSRSIAHASGCPITFRETALKTLTTSCFLIPEVSFRDHSKYLKKYQIKTPTEHWISTSIKKIWIIYSNLANIHVSREHPKAPSRISFSEPTFELKYLCQAKSHSFWPPTLIAVQYTVPLRFGEILESFSKINQRVRWIAKTSLEH